MARKARVEGAAFDQQPEQPKDGIEALIARFKAEYPDRWAEVRNGPFYYGLEVMAECLNS